MTPRAYRPFLVALVAIVAMLCFISTPPPQAVYADNTSQATNLLMCSYTSHDTTYTQTMYSLDKTLSASERKSMESREQYYALWNVAGIYNHEWINYPAYPTSVIPEDLHGWSCKWQQLR